MHAFSSLKFVILRALEINLISFGKLKIQFILYIYAYAYGHREILCN